MHKHGTRTHGTLSINLSTDPLQAAIPSDRTSHKTTCPHIGLTSGTMHWRTSSMSGCCLSSSWQARCWPQALYWPRAGSTPTDVLSSCSCGLAACWLAAWLPLAVMRCAGRRKAGERCWPATVWTTAVCCRRGGCVLLCGPLLSAAGEAAACYCVDHCCLQETACCQRHDLWVILA